MNLTVLIRKFQASDITECITLFQETIHSINIKDYSPIQINLWAPSIKPEVTSRWELLFQNISYVAEYNNQIVGFADLSLQGYLDRLYVHKNFQSRGIATNLLKKLEERANNLNLKEITTAASITAKSFFEKNGFSIVKEQQVDIQGVKFINFAMVKFLVPKLICIREPKFEDKEAFLQAMQSSQTLHFPWVKSPLTLQEFDEYLKRSQQPNQKSFIVYEKPNKLVGVFNVSEIIHGFFQNAYLGFYSIADYTGQGYMSVGLKLVLHKVFHEMKLHRLEANIQPDNTKSINLVNNNGFRKEGYSPLYLKINNQWCDHERWAITYEDFIKNH